MNAPHDASPAVAARGLAAGWFERKRPVALVTDVDLALPAGRFVALVGPNGAGKSTLLRTLVGMQPPVAGELALMGRALPTLSIEERARLAACVFTDRFDSGWFTVRDIVSFGRYPHTDARNRLSAADRRIVDDAIAEVGLAAFASRRFVELSDGEKQKALVARAIAQDSPLLVLDEPTAFLDAPARIEVFHLARRLAREKGKAVIVSTHDIDLALGSADELWLLDRAHRFEAGGPETLALSGALGRAFDGPLVKFDAAAGTFRAATDKAPFAVGVTGDDPVALGWTIRMAERLGCVVEPEDGLYDAEIRAAASPKGPSWTLLANGLVGRFDRLDELADELGRRVRARRGGNPGEPAS